MPIVLQPEIIKIPRILLENARDMDREPFDTDYALPAIADLSLTDVSLHII